MFDDKTVLITGGSGSFGRKCTAMLLKHYKPKKIIIFSRGEMKQFEMSQRFNQRCMRYFIGDVRDFERLKEATNGVNYIIHAAAMKQVPASEYNPMEAIKTNVYGAENVIKAAFYNNIEKVMALSTDKAVTPINLYGATKLASDKLFVAANNMRGTRKTRFSITRYGNVIGSRGSVIPFFQNLIRQGAKELPITDIDMTRFLITLKQGIEFVFKNFERMCGGEIFVPKIPSMKVTDMANAIAPNLPHKIVGIRPGEKLHEVMCPKDESHLTVEFNDHYVIYPSIKFTQENNSLTNIIGERGKRVPKGFEYSSINNKLWLTKEKFLELLDE